MVTIRKKNIKNTKQSVLPFYFAYLCNNFKTIEDYEKYFGKI